jgi:hypothetical protein
MTAPEPVTGFGVTDGGFVRKGFDVILTESLDRTRAVFGASVDLSSTSALRMVLQVAAAEDTELWKALENAYYANYLSTASRDALDLLGDDIAVSRRDSFVAGRAELTLAGGVPGRVYAVPEGTVLVTAATTPFTTDAGVELTAARPVVEVGVHALERGMADLPVGAIVAVDAAYRAVYFADFGAATVTVTNKAPLTGGREPEDNETYRGRLLGVARNLWTLGAVRQAVLDVDGVLDVLLSDPLGGVDVSQSYFNTFTFGQRLFSAERRVGEPYLFDVIVAHEFRWPWDTTGVVRGVSERVRDAIDRVRPPGVHPNIMEADHIDVGVRARVIVRRGHDQPALLTSITDRLARDVRGLRLGGDVLYSQVMGAFVEEPAVIDVQRLHLRRFPAAFGRITFGDVPFVGDVLEAQIGENLVMGPTELAVFSPDSHLHDIEMVTP